MLQILPEPVSISWNVGIVEGELRVARCKPVLAPKSLAPMQCTHSHHAGWPWRVALIFFA